jgi:hypothetical protein
MSNIPGFRELSGSVHRVRKGAKRVGTADPKEIIDVSIYLRHPPNAPPLNDQKYYASRALKPKEHITRQQLAERYGATAADLKAVADFAAAKGLKVIETSAPRRLVRVSGTAAQLATAFSVELFRYESKTEKYRGHEGPIHVPTEIADIVTGVFGLDNRRMARRMGGGGAGNLTPPQVAQAYNFPSGSAAGETIAVLEFSGPTPGIPTCGFAQSDIDGYINFLNTSTGSSLTSINVTPVNIDQTADTPGDVPGGSAANFNIQTDADVEVALDLEVIVSVAQGAKAVVAYFAPMTVQGWADAISHIVMDTTHDPSVLSISWGWPELESESGIDSPEGPSPWPFEWNQMAFSQLTALFQQAANIGMTVFAATGDDGSDGGEDDGNAHVNYPSTDPWITACGGTIINSLSPLSEDTWNDNSTDPGAATGGGVSDLVNPVSWQTSAGVTPTSVNPGGRKGRGVPDVAGNASPNSGYLLYLYGTTSNNLTITAPPAYAGDPLGPVGGTSAVGPLYAALIAIINATLQTRVGYLNPTLYAVGTGTGALGPAVCRDINDGVSNSVTTASGTMSPGYTSSLGWDACTGWGSIDGSALLSLLQGVFQKTMTIVMRRDTFGQNEVTATGGIYQQGLFITVYGLTPSDFPSGGITALSPTATTAQLGQWAPKFGNVTGPYGPTNISITPTAVSSDDPSLSPEVQVFTFTYQITVPASAFDLPSSDYPELVPISATLAATTGMLQASQEIELILAADPYFSNEADGQLYYLSEDIRVFYAVEGSTMFGAPPLGSTPAAAISFIQWIINNISGPNGTGPNGDTFQGLGTTEATSQLSILPFTLAGQMVFNFAIARVRLDGTSMSEEAKTVRAFFRLFQSQSVAMAYEAPSSTAAGVSDPTGAYRQWSDGITNGRKIPLLGISSDGSEYITVPCFASPRVANTSTATNMTTQKDPPNVKNIMPVSNETVYTYFGCWLDNNQLTPVFPFSPGANPDGPFPPLFPVSMVIDRGGHQCIMVEIVDDAAPIINGSEPWTSDKLAQRNLALTVIENPGANDSRLATHTFEVRPSPVPLDADLRPDELMIDWGNIPKGSVASIYLPAVSAAEVLGLAARMYPTHNLSASDAHTLQCPAGGTTYIPVPQGTGPNYAGLLSVQLPLGVRRGQEFTIVVRQITSELGNKREGSARDRYIYGTFQISIPVSTKSAMLIPEERNLSVMKWIQEAIPASNRWYPVFQRYIGQLSGRVTALGGNGATVPPTQTGIWPGLGGTGTGTGTGTGAHGQTSCTGKVDSIIYDHFGDFEGFVLETFDGEHHRFDSHEAPVHKLVQRAWAQRILTTVVLRHGHPRRPFEIILHGAPPPYEE